MFLSFITHKWYRKYGKLPMPYITRVIFYILFSIPNPTCMVSVFVPVSNLSTFPSTVSLYRTFPYSKTHVCRIENKNMSCMLKIVFLNRSNYYDVMYYQIIMGLRAGGIFIICQVYYCKSCITLQLSLMRRIMNVRLWYSKM